MRYRSLRPRACLRGPLRGDRDEPRASTVRPSRSCSGRRSSSSSAFVPAPSATAPGCGRSRSRSRSGTGSTICARSARGALEWIAEVELSGTERHIARLVVREIQERVRFLDNVGIGYLSLDRAAATLSGGEAQRTRLATQIGSALVGVLYVLDEPSIGLHPRDNARLVDARAFARPRQHRARRRARRADDPRGRPPGRPRAGGRRHGGRIVAQGTAAEVELVAESLTGQFLSGAARIAVPARRRSPSGAIEIRGATSTTCVRSTSACRSGR